MQFPLASAGGVHNSYPGVAVLSSAPPSPPALLPKVCPPVGSLAPFPSSSLLRDTSHGSLLRFRFMGFVDGQNRERSAGDRLFRPPILFSQLIFPSKFVFTIGVPRCRPTRQGQARTHQFRISKTRSTLTPLP